MWTRNSIRGFFRPLVRWSVMIESKSGKLSVLDTFSVSLRGGVGVGEWMPTRPPRYWNPVCRVTCRINATEDDQLIREQTGHDSIEKLIRRYLKSFSTAASSSILFYSTNGLRQEDSSIYSAAHFHEHEDGTDKQRAIVSWNLVNRLLRSSSSIQASFLPIQPWGCYG